MAKEAIESRNGEFNYLFGLINFVGIFCIVWLFWYLFMHADGVMKLYTPMYGFALVAILFSSIVLLGKVLGWPADTQTALSAGAALTRGIWGVVISLALMFFIFYFVFWEFIGNLGVAYFSPSALVASGGAGAEPWNAREWSSTAILYFATAFLWWALVWNLGFVNWPWQADGREVIGFSRLVVVLLLSIITYAILFHSHVCLLFPDAQKMAGADPWWEDMAQTGSAYFGLGLVLCSLMWVVFCDLLWEGRPLTLLDNDGQGSALRGAAAVLGSLGLGIVSLVVLGWIFNIIWEEPYVGGQYTDGPDWRFIHMGEVAGFCILAAFILKHYFNNFPSEAPLAARAVIRTILSLLGGLLIYWFYYSSLAGFFLGKVGGWAQPDDAPLVWTMLFLCVIIIQADFFRMWPLRRAQ